MVIRRIAVGTAVAAVALVACKGGEHGSPKCKAECAHVDDLLRDVGKSLDDAAKSAGYVEQMKVTTDDEIKREGARAEELCESIRRDVVYARGIAHAQAGSPITSYGGFSSLEGALGDAEKKITCEGQSPAQMKSSLVPMVKALKVDTKYDDAACSASCSKK